MIKGGLGNQLFCYAAARSLALKNNAELIVDDVSGFLHDYDYQRYYQLVHFNISCRKATMVQKLVLFSRVGRFLKRRFNNHLPFEMRAYIQQEGIDFDARLLHLKIYSTVYMEGYWQSEGYFKDVESTIRSDLRILPPTDARNVATGKRIRDCKSVALHVRFFDSPQDAGGSNASRDYYDRAVGWMEANLPGAHYFIFSDRPDIARTVIPLQDERITCISHNQGDENAYADLWLMTQCQHFIIANSTFSWWGAWLASHPDKQVVAPGIEMRTGKVFWGFDGLLPEEWIKL
jgi:hypothetical protein